MSTAMERETEGTATAADFYKSERIPVPMPITVKDRIMIKLLADRYEGRDGTPVMDFICDGVLTLVVPAHLRLKRSAFNKPHPEAVQS